MADLLRLARVGLAVAGLTELIATGCSSSLQTGGGTGGSAQAGAGGGGGGAGGSADAGVDGLCHDEFSGGAAAPCCPDPPPDCSTEPDGYPGNHCVDRHNQFCSCACWSGQWQCGC